MARVAGSPGVGSGRAAAIAISAFPIVAGLVAAAGAIFRQAGTPAFRTIWAEDGQVFAQCALTGPGLIGCLLTPYDAWIHVAPRGLAQITVLLPPELFAISLNLLAALIAGACAVLVARAVRDVTGSMPLAVVAGACLTLVRPSLAEVGGNITNLHWILFAASATILVTAWLGHVVDVADVALLVLTASSSPFTLLLVGLAVVGLVLRRPRMRLAVLALAVLAFAQLIVQLTAPRIELPVASSTPINFISWYVRDIASSVVFGGGALPNVIVQIALVAVIVGLAIYAALSLRRPPAGIGRRAAVLNAIVQPTAPLALVGCGAAVVAAAFAFNHHAAQRHVYDLAALTVIAVVLGVGLLTRDLPTLMPRLTARRTGAVAVGCTILFFAAGFILTFRGSNGASPGPNYPVELEGQRASCSTGSVTASVRISPLPSANAADGGWHIEIPCDRLAR